MNIDDEKSDLTPWTASEVADVEGVVGALPAAYRRFVLEYGHGYFTSQGLPRTDAVVGKFIEPMFVMHKTGFAEWIPASYYPVIGGTGGGLAIERGTGCIYFADYDLGAELGLESESSEDIMSKYSDSWEALEEEMRSWLYG
ncbi:hypothetical protein [Tsukamurella ocularis]|uniref:hypothetical protein n=1 Tax=Tsukamurella ocularis TaxID=1970234 RepID=UPI00216A2B7B|nr:hypothetical protein [Tsukamurella ocularis]MCS3782079.1 hypothetical protein [Tsukamurella ocularis]MCS3788573.1 hypothetical protein [Tsukamurella ocularis]MCS3852293.1 hypothetical protein [Tsukamurella ocularis]